MCWIVVTTFCCRHTETWKEPCRNVKHNQACMGRVEEEEMVNEYCGACEKEVIAAMGRLSMSSAADKNPDAGSGNTNSKK